MCLKHQSHLKSWVLPLGLQLSPQSAGLRAPSGLLSHHCSPNLSKEACSEPFLAVNMNLSLRALRGTLLGWQKLGSILGTWALLGAIGDTKMTKMG